MERFPQPRRPVSIIDQPRWIGGTPRLVIVALLGILVSAAIFEVVERLERSRAEAHFLQVAEQRLSTVRIHVAGALDTVAILASHFEATGDSGSRRRAFATLVAPVLARHRYLQALEWIPRVERSARPGYERLARADGMPGFSFTEILPGGALGVAGLRDQYFPVFYVEPLAGNEKAVGYDLASNPVRQAALMTARDTGELVATARIRLLQEKADQWGTLVFAPVYQRSGLDTVEDRRDNLQGFALSVVKISDLIAAANYVPRSLDTSRLVDIRLFDLTAPDSDTQLYPKNPAGLNRLRRGLYAEQRFEVGGRTWLLQATPGSAFNDRPLPAGTIIIFVFGFVATGICLLYLKAKLAREEQLARSAREIQRAQAQLTQTNEMLETVIQCSPLAVVTLDLEGKVTLWNPAAERIHGWTQAEMMGRFLPVSPQDNPAEVLQVHNRILNEGDVTNLERPCLTKQGSLVMVSVSGARLHNASGERNGAVYLVMDITERKRAEEAQAEAVRLAHLRAEVGAALTRGGTLREGLQECAEALVRGTGVAFARIWTLDPAATVLALEASAGLYTHIDGGHARVPVGAFKIGRIAQTRRPHLSNDVQNDPEVADYAWARRQGLVSFVGHPLLLADEVAGVAAAFGRQPLSDATVSAFASIASQIAQFIQGKRAEKALQRSEGRARLLFATIPHPAYVFDLETLDFLEVNDRAVERYGYSRAEFLRMKTSDIRSAAEAARLKEYLRAHPVQEDVGQWQHRTKDGRLIDVEITRQSIDYGGHKAALTVAQDVTERKKLELDLRQAQKLEAVGGLAAGIAHEINTPIQFVGDNLHFLQDAFGSLEGLLKKCQNLGDVGGTDPVLIEVVNQTAAEADLEYLTEEIPKALVQSLDGVARVATIVKAMKDFAHPEQNQKMAADLNQALTSTLVVARNELKYVADVETDLGELPPVECHLGDMNQVFLNLLVNAAHAIASVVDGTGERGKIRVETRHDGDWVRIAISDTGCGIPEQIHAKVFDPFFTTKGVGRGTGQGLAIARSIVVDRHGGTLTFTSEVGRGTTFRIGLPVSSPAA